MSAPFSAVKAPFTLSYSFPAGNGPVTVRLGVPELVPLLRQFYPSYQCADRTAPAAAAALISLERADRGYKLVGPSGDWYAEEAGEAVALYEAELTDVLLADASQFIHLHGAAVRGPEGCALLIGPSSTGKSTLAFGLQLAGHQALTDDVILVDPTSGAVRSFERSIRVHRKALHRLDVDAELLARHQVCEPYLWAQPSPKREDEPEWHSPSALVFLERDRRTCLERLSSAEGLGRLMVGRFGPGQSERDFESLSRLASITPGYRLRIRRFPEAVNELLRTFFPTGGRAERPPPADA